MTRRSGWAELWPGASVGEACGLDKEDQAAVWDPMVELARALGAQVREVREGLGWSRSVLTRYSGTSRAWLTRLEEGTAVPSVVVLTRLATAMGKRVSITLVDERDALPARSVTRKEASGQ